MIFIIFVGIILGKVTLRKLSFLIFALLTPMVCLPQQSRSNYFPDYYSSTALGHPALINPAANNIDTKGSLNTLYKSRTGPFNEVASFSAYADIAVKPKNNIGHVARLLFQNEREGPYISSPRFYGNYSVKVPVSEDISIAAGFALGIASLSFSAPSGMGRASAPDGNAGLVFRYRKTELGAASYQIFNSEVVAINSTLVFKRFFQFYLQSEKELSPSLTVKGHLYWRPQPLRDFVNAAVILDFKETIAMGAMYQLNRGASFITSLQLNKSRKPLIINFSYNSLFLSSFLFSTASFEVGLQYRINQE